MQLPKPLQTNGSQRIALLKVAKWLAFPVLPVLGFVSIHRVLPWVLWCVLCIGLFFAVRAWEDSRRRQFIREARMPSFLGAKLRQKYPQLSPGDTDLVLRGLRQFFMAHLRSQRRFVAMPSQVADDAWHAFILHTKAYEAWCHAAFGKLLHHTPAEVLGKDPKSNDGLRRTWYWACKEESINPRTPTRLPLLFALDKKFAIPGGFSYVPDCRAIDRASGSGDYCGTSFGSEGGGGDGGSESNSSGSIDGDSNSGSDSSGCGGGD